MSPLQTQFILHDNGCGEVSTHQCQLTSYDNPVSTLLYHCFCPDNVKHHHIRIVNENWRYRGGKVRGQGIKRSELGLTSEVVWLSVTLYHLAWKSCQPSSAGFHMALYLVVHSKFLGSKKSQNGQWLHVHDWAHSPAYLPDCMKSLASCSMIFKDCISGQSNWQEKWLT